MEFINILYHKIISKYDKNSYCILCIDLTDVQGKSSEHM